MGLGEERLVAFLVVADHDFLAAHQRRCTEVTRGTDDEFLEIGLAQIGELHVDELLAPGDEQPILLLEQLLQARRLDGFLAGIPGIDDCDVIGEVTLRTLAGRSPLRM